jgi:hypothetical protein
VFTRVGERYIFLVSFNQPPPELRDLFIIEAIGACVLRLHFEQQPCRVFLTLRRPSADALQYGRDLILFHPVTISRVRPAYILWVRCLIPLAVEIAARV